MKAIKSIRFIATLMALAAFMLVIKSCKKVDNSGTTNAEAAKAAAIQSVKAQYGDISAGIVYNVNKAADEYFYKNTEGKMVSLYGAVANAANGPDISAPNPPGCQYNCTNTTNPANLRLVYTLNQVQRFYDCETATNAQQSKVSVDWTVSVPFVIGGPKPTFSTGDVKFINASGVTLLTLTASTGSFALGINYLGPDPACTTGRLYKITYMFNNVANGYFASGNTIKASLSLANDCALLGNVAASGDIAAPAFSQNAYLPCNRIDKVYITPGSTTVLGNAAALCTQPSGWIYPDYQQLEYRKVVAQSGSLNWADQTDAFGNPSTVYWSIPLGSSSPAAIFAPTNGGSLASISANSGMWLIRYRNVKTGTCNTINPSGPPNGNWGNTALWVTEAYPF
jgi:hypothetical protein